MAVAAAKSKITRSNNNIWLIGFPKETISGARLPSGLDVMKNCVYYHRQQKLNINTAAQQVHDQLLPFWVKSRLPVRQKQHILQKIKDLYAEQVRLMKHRKRNNSTDQMNQKEYTEKLSNLFDISHANSEQLIKNDEDRQFLKLQRESRTGSIGSVDKKLAAKEKRVAERQKQFIRDVGDAAKDATSQCPQHQVQV